MNMKNIQQIVEENGIIFLTYGKFLSQSLIQSMIDSLEQETQDSELNMGISVNLFTIFVELSQNMMNYSKTKDENCTKVVANGLIVVSKDDESYLINSQNIVSLKDKQKMEPKLIDVTTLDRDGIKKRYKELRRSGKDTHSKGGGLGFYEIAKRCNEVSYKFDKINDDKYYFHIQTKISINK